MAPKRCFNGDAESGSEDSSAHDPKRFKNANIRDLLGLFSVQDMVESLEPFIRGVVRDEVERTVLRVLHPSFRPSFNQNETSGGGRGFLLCFVNRPPGTIFTGSRVETEDGNPIRIELLDAKTKTLVTSGPVSCMKIELLVLDGDFGSDDREDWTENQFNSNLIREREGRRPLLAGELNVTLRGGVALVNDIAFTDNSSWQRSRKFRLGAKPVSTTCGGNGQAMVREARSEAFKVMDHRGELYKKHYPPHLDDDVWRLERIAKDGTSHKKLSKSGILTVRDFLQSFAVNPSELRRILGGTISNKIWDTIIEHADTCVLDEKLYAYFGAGQNVGLLFSSVYKLMGTYDGQAFEPLEKLTPPQIAVVENLKQQAYKNLNEFILIDARTVTGFSRPLICPEIDSFHSQNLGPQQLEFSVAHQDQPEMVFEFSTAENVTNQTHLFSSNPRDSFKLSDFLIPSTPENNWPASSSQWPIVTTTNDASLAEDITLQAQVSSAWPATSSSVCWGQGNTFVFSSDNNGGVDFLSSYSRFGVHMSRIRKTKAGWCKLRAAILKWGSVRRNVAAKRFGRAYVM